MSHTPLPHQIHGLFPFAFSDAKNHRDILEKARDNVLSWTPESLSLTQTMRVLSAGNAAPDQPVWQTYPGKGVAIDDLYPFAQQILGGAAENFPLLCATFDLAQSALLSQRKGGKPRLWTLSLSASAQKRCGSESLTVQVDRARLYLFRTGIGILDLSWHYHGATQTKEILEGNYALSHGQYRRAAKGVEASENTAMDPDALRLLAENLAGPLLKDSEPMQSGRRVLYSIVQIPKKDLQVIDLLTAHLSHRQSTDYQLSLDMIQSTVWSPFPYLCHGASLEGGASVMRDTETASDFGKNFVAGTGANTYLPLAIASLHSHFWLLNRTQWIPARRHREGSLSEMESVEEIFSMTVDYRRYFHYPIVSQISLHNLFYHLWQEALQIPERIRFQEQTAKDVAELLSNHRARWIGRISGAVGGFLLTHEFLEALSTSGFPFAMPNMRVWFVEAVNKSPIVLHPMVELVEHWELTIFLGSLLGSLLGLWLTWNFNTSFKKD
jgi:hypothetical protein